MAFKVKNAFELECSLARISGHIEGTALYDDSVPVKAKLGLLQLMIDEFKKLDPDSEWIEQWENIKKELSK